MGPRKTAMARPVSAYYSYNVKRNDSDTESKSVSQDVRFKKNENSFKWNWATNFNFYFRVYPHLLVQEEVQTHQRI